MAFTTGMAKYVPNSVESWHKILVAGLVMVGQRIPETFFAIALPALYRDEGLPLDKFWIFGLLYVPSWFKFLWAPYLDRLTLTRLGRRRSWILLSAISLSFSFFLMSFFTPTISNFTIVAVIMVLTGFFFATGDIALDTYIIEMFDKSEQPFGGALNRFADVLVVFIAVSGLFWSMNVLRWQSIMLIASGILLVLGACILLRKEPVFPEVARANLANGYKVSFMRSLKQRHMIYALPLSASMCAVIFMLIQAPSAFLVDIGFDLNDVGYALGVPQTIAGLIGACVAAIIVNWQGLKRSALILIGITLAGIAGMMFLSTLSQPSLLVLSAIIFVWGFAAPFFVVLIITALYRWTSLSQAATDYTVMASAAFFGISLAPGLYGFIAGALDWTSFYMISAILVTSVGLAFVILHDKIQGLVDTRNIDEEIASKA